MPTLRLRPLVALLVLPLGAQAAQKIQVTPNPVPCGGAKIGQSASPVTVTVANVGDAQLSVGNITFAGMHVAEFKANGIPAPPIKLAPGTSFPFTITLTPLANGPRSATMTVNSDDPGSPMLNVALTGSGGDPKISLDVGTVAFGNVRVGTTSMPAQVITISNSGGGDLKITSLSLAGAHPNDFVLSKMNLPGTVKAMGNEKISLSCKPSQLGGRSGRVVISSDDAQSPTTFIDLLCTGTMANLSAAPAAIDFGNQRAFAASSPKGVTITNAGMDFANVTMITFTGPQAMWFALSSPPPLPAKIPQNNGTLAINVSAVPLAVGPGTATLNIMTDDAMKPSFQATLKVTGVSSVAAVSPNFIDFGAVDAKSMTKPVPITLSNTGMDVLTLSDFQLDGDHADAFTIGNEPMIPMMGLPIMPGQKITWDVTFKPMGLMLHRAYIELRLDDPKAKLIKIPLDGVGAMSGLTAMPMSIDFGGFQVNTASAPREVTISNTGDTPIMVGMLSVGGAAPQAFKVEPSDPFTLQGMQSQKVYVTFQPPGGNVFNATLDITPMGLSPVKVTLKGTGILPQLGVQPAEIDFGEVQTGQSKSDEVRVKNFGTSAVKIGTIMANNSAFVVDASATMSDLGPMGETSFNVKFTPAMEGKVTANIIVTLATGAQVLSIPARGEGVKPVVRRQPTGCAMAAPAPASSMALLGMLLVAGLVAAARRRR